MKTDILKTIGNAVTSKVGRMSLKIQKYSPEILITVGIVGIGVGVVYACKASRELDDVVDDIQKDIDDVKEKHSATDENGDIIYNTFSKDYRGDLTRAYFRSVMRFIKLYGKSAFILLTALCCILASYDVQKSRTVKFAAYATGLEETFKRYRGRVVEELGEEADERFHHGIKKRDAEVIETDEKGKEKKVSKEEYFFTEDGYKNPSVYAKFFDETCTNWSKDPSRTMCFLKNQERFANEMLNCRGHVFLNEVYDMLDIPRTKEGAVVGWIKKKGNANYIDFGLHDEKNTATRRFVNGYENVILLDFNVDGLIYDQI